MGHLGKWTLIFVILTGTAAGIGAFTFRYGEGLSYFSTDPRACKNCHVMNDQYASWAHGPHHAVARCVDCHLPHEFIPKYLATVLEPSTQSATCRDGADSVWLHR